MNSTMKDPKQVFVLGPARSGTSVMLLALRRVFQLEGRGESHVLPIFWRMMKAFDAYKQGLTPNVTIQSLQASDIQNSFRELLQNFYSKQFPTGRWVDKTPGVESLLAAHLIREFFPEAKLIITKRNGIEVVESFRRKFGVSFEAACGAWARAMSALGGALSPSVSALVVDQFELANQTASVAERVAAHLGQPEASTRLAEFLGSERRDTHSTHDWGHRLTLADTDWSPEEKEIFSRLCGEYMSKFCYKM